MSLSPRIIWPARLAPATISCIRLSMRRNVDLPHPDGPIRAVTVPGSIVRETRSSTLCVPNHADTLRASRPIRRLATNKGSPGRPYSSTDVSAGAGGPKTPPGASGPGRSGADCAGTGAAGEVSLMYPLHLLSVAASVQVRQQRRQVLVEVPQHGHRQRDH